MPQLKWNKTKLLMEYLVLRLTGLPPQVLRCSRIYEHEIDHLF